MFDLISILSLAGWIYLFYVVIDYLGNKLFNLRLLKQRGIIKEVLLIILGFAIFILVGIISGKYSFYGILFLLFRMSWICFFSLVFILIVLKIYQYVAKSKRGRVVGLLISIIFITFNLEFSDYRILLCQISYENISKTILPIAHDTKRICAERVAVENNEPELCANSGDYLSECYYELGVKTNDESFCKKIEEEGKYIFFASDCYYEIALNKKDVSLCRNAGNRTKSCYVKLADISDITKSVIRTNNLQLCFQEYSQEDIDRCYYDSVKFYYGETDYYRILECQQHSALCGSNSKEEKELAREVFIELCNNIKDENLRNDCYDFKEAEEKYVVPINTGVKLVPDPSTDPETMLHAGPNPQRMHSEGMEITAGQKWNKNTKLKYCIRYKSNTNSSKYRSAILHANSSLENKYIFQVDIYEYKTDYYCDSWANIRGGGTYRIIIPFKTSFSNKDTFHEICIDDINSQLDYCILKWGINKDDAYLTNIHQASIFSPSSSLNDYAVFDHFRIFVDGNQVPELLFPNQNFDKFLGSTDDNNSDDFEGWKEYKNAYAIDIEE